jgi:hypothetical protein
MREVASFSLRLEPLELLDFANRGATSFGIQLPVAKLDRILHDREHDWRDLLLVDFYGRAAVTVGRHFEIEDFGEALWHVMADDGDVVLPSCVVEALSQAITTGSS